MTHVGESYQSRLSREKAAILAKLISAKRALQEKLRRQQDLKTEFSVNAKELFEPITTATEKIVSAIEEFKLVVVPPTPKKKLTMKRFKNNEIDSMTNFWQLLISLIRNH